MHLKPLVCISISTGSTWDIGTKNRYVIPQGFGSRMCTLTIPTICTIDTVTKVVGKIKQWRDSLANTPVEDIPRDQNIKNIISSSPPFPSSAINPTVIRRQPGHPRHPRHHPRRHPSYTPPSSTVDSHRRCPGHHPPPLPLQFAATLQHEQQRGCCLSTTNPATAAAAASDRRSEGNYGKGCQYAVSQ